MSSEPTTPAADATVPDTTALAARVEAGLRAAGYDGPATGLEPMPGGHSGLTYRTAAGEHAFVVKAVPAG